MGQLCDRVGRTGRQDQQVHGVSETDVQHMRLAAPQICIDERPPASDRLKGKGSDELFRRPRQDDIHLGPGLGKFGRQVRGLVRGNGPGHAKEDAST